MKKSTVKPKLELVRSTIKPLTNEDLSKANGGVRCCTGALSGCGNGCR